MKCSSPVTSTSTSAPTIAVITLDIDAMTKTDAAVSARPRDATPQTAKVLEPGAAVPSEHQRRDYHGDADGDGFVQCLQHQFVRKAGTQQGRQHAKGEAVELDVVFDPGNGERPEQQVEARMTIADA